MTTLVVEVGRNYEVTCDLCPEYREVRRDEQAATYESARHESRDNKRRADSDAAIAYYKTVKIAPPTVGHRHTASCTREGCPGSDTWFCAGPCVVFLKDQENVGKPCAGHSIPSRAELVARSRRKKGLVA